MITRILTVYLDAETVSRIDLPQVGARTYAEDPSTRVLCWSWAIDDGPVQVWWPGDPQPVELIEALTAGCRVVAHNFQFDATIWDRLMVPEGWPAIPVERWSCTSFRCRLARLPASVEEAARALDLLPKDLAGKKLVLSLSKRDLVADPLTDEEREQADAYCRHDTVLCRTIDRLVPEMPEQWRELFLFDFTMNERGMPIDMSSVEKLIVVRDEETMRLKQRFGQLCDNELRSPKQNKKFRAKLAGIGVDLPNLQHDTLEDWVEANPRRDDLAARLILTALEWSHSSDSKLDRMIEAARVTGRARDLFVLHGAHTARWAARNTQPQNLPKNVLADSDAMLKQLLDRSDAIVAGTLDPMHDPGWTVSIKEAISGCLRSLIKAPEGWVVVSADLGQIESRILCWISSQDDKLELYRAGKDVYIAEARGLGSDSRDLGKLFVLSAGYGASGRVMFGKAPGFGVVLTEQEAYEKTDLWRKNNPAIIEFWYELYRTLSFCLELPPDQKPIVFRGLNVWRDSEMMFVRLPSGRTLKYRDPVMGLNDRGFPQITVQLPKKGKLQETSIWHGSVTENVISGMAFDILVEKMLQLHRDGVFIIGTVHDEIVALASVEDADAVREHMVQVMQMPPAWAVDLPLSADAFVNQRFTKPAKSAHALLAPSSAERWMNCPGSIFACQALPEPPESAFAAEGTEAHRIFAHCLEKDADPVEFTTDFMVLRPLQIALQIARDVIAGRKFRVEIRLDPIPGIGKVWGTADVLIFDEADRIVAIVDLKFGAGVTVEPDSLQLQVYALLAAQKYGCTFGGIDLHIIQPRRQHEHGPHRVHHIGISELTDLHVRLQDAVKATEDPSAVRVAGDWCRFCRARQDCAEARSVQPLQRPLINPFLRGAA